MVCSTRCRKRPRKCRANARSACCTNWRHEQPRRDEECATPAQPAEPFRGRLGKWSYVQPDIHVGYFEPGTLATALRGVGLQPAFPGYMPGFTDLLRYKILKNLRQKRRHAVEGIIPWPLVARAVDCRYRVSAQPIAWKR